MVRILSHDVCSLRMFEYVWHDICGGMNAEVTVRSHSVHSIRDTVFAVEWLRVHGLILLLCSGGYSQLAPLAASSCSASTCS